ncbi:MAG: NADH-quinone oxidoreductase subunit A [Bdellovibrionaceae bacterium]|nr:NADH-quinone oxidoreductase subunit A [Pseudobdellovibrionaceae bacterium]
MTSLVAVLILTLFVIAFGAGLLYLVSLVGPKPKFSSLKDASYECGLPAQETGHSKIPVKFYLTAILFILFDIEIIFMYPWAISFVDFIENDMGLHVLLSMGFFLFVFIFGLIWEIKSRALEWE